MNLSIYPPDKTVPTPDIALPLSKSESNRALIISALAAQNEAKIPEYAVADCDDTRAMKMALQRTSGTVNIGAAGTTMRFMTAYYAATEGVDVTLDGSERMRKRPIRPLVEALQQIGADIEYDGEYGFPPLRIKGKKLMGGTVVLDGSISSQFISALMMIGPMTAEGLTIKLEGYPTSLPYILMTLSMMNRAGVSVMMNDNCIMISPANYLPVKFEIEGDWSAASYWYEIVSTGCLQQVNIKKLNLESMQGDRVVADIFDRIGVYSLTVRQPNVPVVLKRVPTRTTMLTLNLKNCPDIAQTVAVTCCLRNIPFKLSGLGTLPRKETDRLKALCSELLKLGFQLTIEDDNSALAWDRSKIPLINDLQPIDTFDDHRMAMAFAPAAAKFPGIVINHAEVVSKSYPTFWDDLEAAGFKLVEV